MKDVNRARWLASFDAEPFLSAILRNGTLMSMGLVVAGLVVRWAGKFQTDLGPNLRAKSIPQLILADIHSIGSLDIWPRLLVHLGVSVLLLTPYARVIASMVYFTWVESDRKHALLAAFILAVLSILLLTDWV